MNAHLSTGNLGDLQNTGTGAGTTTGTISGTVPVPGPIFGPGISTSTELPPEQPIGEVIAALESEHGVDLLVGSTTGTPQNIAALT